MLSDAAFSPAAFQAAVTTSLAQLRAFTASLSPRDRAMLGIGEHLSHAEEAAATGDWPRAASHLTAVSQAMGRTTGTLGRLGDVLSIAQLVALAQGHGFPDPATAAAVAMAESGGNTDAVGDMTITPPYGSVGLWQINLAAHPQYDVQSLHNADYNASAAFAVSSGGTNWQPWSTFTTTNPALSYRRFLPAAQAAAGTTSKNSWILPIGVAAGALLLLGAAYEEGYFDWLRRRLAPGH